MKKLSLILLLAILTTVIPCMVSAFENTSTFSNPSTGAVQGIISDASTGNPLQGAWVGIYNPHGSSKYTETDSTGYYILSGVSAGSTQIHVTDYGYNSASHGVVILANDTTDVDVALVPVPPPPPPPPPPPVYYGVIQGTVTDVSTGTPIAGATVAVTSNGGHDSAFNWSWARTSTDNNGSYIISNVSIGSTVVYAKAYGYSVGYQSVNVIANDTSIANLALTPIVQPSKGSVSGTVTDANTGLPIAGAFVYARPSSDHVISKQYQGHDCDGDKRVVTDSTGNYILYNLYTGDYNITASKDGYQGQTDPVTVVGSSTVTVDFSLQTTVVTNGSITGTVSDASTGLPLVGAFVFVSIDVENWYGKLNHLWTQTDSTGSYELDNVPAGAQTVKALLKGYKYGKQTVTVLTNDTVTANFALSQRPQPAKGAITGTVSDASTGLPLAGARIFVREDVYDLAIASKHNFANTTTDVNGNYTIVDISTGIRYVVAFDDGYQPSEQQATILANQTTQVEFSLVPYDSNTSSITVHVILKNPVGTKFRTTPVADATVFIPVNDQILPTSDWDKNWNSTDGSGKTSISNIPSGSQVIVVQKDGFDSKLVNTTLNGSNTTITVEISPSSR